MTFNKEQLQQIIETDHVQCGDASALARIALASLEAEPVAWISERNLKNLGKSYSVYVKHEPVMVRPIPLYTAPPAPASVPISFEEWSRKCDLQIQLCGPQFREKAQYIWNACRAAMLQCAAGNSPAIPDGWVACSERMPTIGEKVLAYRPDAPESNDPLIKMAKYVGKSAHGHGFDCYCKPSHWMPLPASPQQEAK